MPSQPAAPVPSRSPSALGSHPAGPVVAGAGEFGVGGEEAGPEEEADPEEEAEEGGEEAEVEGGEDEGEEGEDECSLTFTVFFAGAPHELVLCRDTSGEEDAFYLLLDGEPVALD